ncbi:MAG TPA: hypothetical protein VEJ88_00650 [Dissulfurispiraceae bacterium]|nr:hypothetical protein [Dissulfurispiraceae bacterium]
MKVLLFILVTTLTLMVVCASASAFDYAADLSLAAGEEYNDNIFLDHSDKIHDFITTVSPYLAFSTKTGKVTVTYSPTFNFYEQHSGLNYTSQAASARGVFQISDKTSLGISDQFIESKSPLYVINSLVAASTTPVVVGPFVTGQSRITTNTAEGDVAYQMSGKVALKATTVYAITGDAQGLEDETTYGGSLSAVYSLTDKTRLRANANYSYFNYRGSGSSNASDQTYTVGANCQFTQTLDVDVYGGLDISRIDQPGNTNVGPAAGVSVNKGFWRGMATLAYTRSVTAGYQSSTPLEAQVLSLRYSVPGKGGSLTPSIYGWYGRYRTLNGATVSATEDRNDYGASAELALRLSDWSSLILSYSHINSDDQFAKDNSYVNNIGMITFKIGKQLRF